jgi:hypothetical protein
MNVTFSEHGGSETREGFSGGKRNPFEYRVFLFGRRWNVNATSIRDGDGDRKLRVDAFGRIVQWDAFMDGKQ